MILYHVQIVNVVIMDLLMMCVVTKTLDVLIAIRNGDYLLKKRLWVDCFSRLIYGVMLTYTATYTKYFLLSSVLHVM